MFAKLLAITLSLGIVGCILLVNRQQRVEAAHEMSVIHERLAEHEKTVWQLRAEIARRCSPRELRDATERHAGHFVPFVQGMPDDRAQYENVWRLAGDAAHALNTPDEDWGG